MFSFITVVLAGPALLVSCSGKPAAASSATVWEAGKGGDAIAVESVTASRGILVSSVSASGVVAGVNEAVAVSETAGIIRKLSFSIGDTVAAGQELLKVDDSIAALNLQRAKDQLDSANLELRGNEQISESGGSSPAALIKARSAVSAAKAQYETALKAFNDTTLRSPIGGIIASREDAATVGNILGAATRVARIIDNSSFRITVGVGEREIGLIESGAKVRISVPSALGESTVNGSVFAVGAGSDPSTGSFPVVISFRNEWGNLVKSGMSATVDIEARASKPVMVVPVAALVRRDNRYALFLEKNGTATVREVSVGRRIGVRTEILSGLSDGDMVIISALSRLQNGTSVTAASRGDSASYE